MKYYIYKHSFQTGEVYIGRTQQDRVNKRWKAGFGYSRQPAFYEAIMDAGWNTMEHIIIDETDDLNDSKLRESYYVAREILSGKTVYNVDDENTKLTQFIYDNANGKYYPTMYLAGQDIGLSGSAVHFTMTNSKKGENRLGHSYKMIEFKTVEELDEALKITPNIEPYTPTIKKRAEIPYVADGKYFINRKQLADYIGCSANSISSAESRRNKKVMGIEFRRATTEEIAQKKVLVGGLQ